MLFWNGEMFGGEMVKKFGGEMFGGEMSAGYSKCNLNLW